MPGWKGSNRRRRLPRNWTKIRKDVLERDEGRCQYVREDNGLRCGRPASDVDHIRRGDDDSHGNLRAICDWHHQRKSSREGGQASAKRRKRQGRPFDGHPGIID